VWQKHVYSVTVVGITLYKNVQIFQIECSNSAYNGPVFVDELDICLCETEDLANLRRLMLAYKNAVDFCERDNAYVVQCDSSVQSFLIEAVYLHNDHVGYRARQYATGLVVYFQSNLNSMFRTSMECELFLKKQSLHIDFYKTKKWPMPQHFAMADNDCFYDVESGFPRYNRVIKTMNWSDVGTLNVEGQSCMCLQEWSPTREVQCIIRGNIPRFNTRAEAAQNVETRRVEKQLNLNIGQPFFVLQSNEIFQYVVLDVWKQAYITQYVSVDLATQLHNDSFTSEMSNIFLTFDDALFHHKLKIFENWYLVLDGVSDLLCTEIDIGISPQVDG